MQAEPLRDICHLLGGLLLDGANVSLLDKVREQRMATHLAEASEGLLADRMRAIEAGLEADSSAVLAAEYTRLFIANGEAGARGKIPVPPYEDCHSNGDGQVLGERSLAAFKAYVAAGLGFEGMKGHPSDHIGLELCFVAALLNEEANGARDESARCAFMNGHLASFAATVGGALIATSRRPFWAGVGRALSALPRGLQPAAADSREAAGT